MAEKWSDCFQGWINGRFLSKDIQACEASRAEDKDQILSNIADIQETRDMNGPEIQTPSVQSIKAMDV